MTAINSWVSAIARKYAIRNDEAFEILSAALILDKSFEEVYGNIWTGGVGVNNYDCGFDAIYLEDQTNVLYLFQSKNNQRLTDLEVDKLRSDYDDFFVGDNRSSRQVNIKVAAKLEEYRDLANRGLGVTAKLFFVYNGKNNDPDYSNNASIFNRINTQTTGPEYKIIDADDLSARLSNFQHGGRIRSEFTFRPLDTNIPTYSRQALFSFIIGQTTGASFRIEIKQLCDLIENEIRINGSMDTLFSENIRGYLGCLNKTNKNIKKTLLDNDIARFFPFMNNGITIICDKVNIPQDPAANIYNIQVENPVIVNGLQTSRVIYDIYKNTPSILDEIYITLKVYESNNPSLTELITEATNTQTPINYRDQISNKVFNDHAAVYFSSKGVKYIYKRGQIVRGDDLSEGLNDSVSNETVLKFWYATFNRSPKIAKGSKGRLLEDIFLATKGENPSLNSLFDGNPESPLYSQLFIAYKIQRFVISKRMILVNQEGNDYLLHADEMIAYGLYMILDQLGAINNIDQLDQNLEENYNLIKEKIKNISDTEKARRGESYSHTKYFKSDAVVLDYNSL